MKTASPADHAGGGGSGSRPTPAGREPGLPVAWLLAGASLAIIGFIYFFAFRAAHTAQIREVPLATKGGRP